MASFLKQLKELLQAAGCHFHRNGKGDHEIWFSPVNGAYFTVDRGTKSRHTANESLKQAGLPKHF
jgi:hypothetical protein